MISGSHRHETLARTGLLAFCFLAVFSTAGYAQDDKRRDAKAAYAQALQLLESGRIAEAAEHLEQAYALSPHYAVLYNLGKAYALLNRPVDALATFSRYLDEGGSGIDASRRAEVEQFTQRLQAQVTRLKLRVEPQGAVVQLDEHVLGTAPIDKIVPVMPGDHHLSIRRDGFAPFVQAVHLEPGELRTFSISLTGLQAAWGAITVTCPLVDVAVFVDDERLATTPLKSSLRVPSGRRSVRLERDGYKPQRLDVDVGDDTTRSLACRLEAIRGRSAARLQVTASEPGASVYIDGQPAPDDGVLPAGRHTVVVEHNGFLPWQRLPVLAPDHIERLHAKLVPTEQYRRDYERRARAMRTWAYISAGGGLVLLAGASGLLLWNNGRYDDWKQKDAELQRIYDAGPTSPAWSAAQDEQDKNDALLHSIKVVDGVTVATAIVGAAGVATGVVLRFVGPAPDKYNEISAVFAPGSAGVRLRSHF